MLYAAYGSNLHPLRLQERVPSAELLGKGVLPGRELRFHKRSVDGSGKGDIVHADGEVHIAVYDVSEAQRPALDRAEGLGAGYRVETVEVPGRGGCFTYVAMDSYVDPTLRPYGWYRDLVLVGCAHLGFPEGYVRRITAVTLWDDPDPGRRAANQAIVRRARDLTSRDRTR